MAEYVAGRRWLPGRPATAIRAAWTASRSSLWRDKVAAVLLRGAASMSLLIVLLIFLFLGKEAAPLLFGPEAAKLLGTRWVPVSFQQQQFGLLPLVGGSLVVTLLATILTVPFGVAAAVYIAELAKPWERELLKPFVELLAGLPSVVIGFFGLVVLAPWVKGVFGLSSGLTALTGALLLALMAAPTVITISEDAIRSVPESYKSASLALGAGRLQTLFRVTVPAALSGIIAAVMLGMGRVIGETMAVLMVTGNAAVLTASPLSPVRTMTATIAAEMGEVPFGSDHYRALFCVGIVLLVTTFALAMIAQRVLKKHENR